MPRSERPVTLVMLPPQTAATRAWARRLEQDVPKLAVHVPEDEAGVRALLPEADAAFGTLTPDLLALAPRLRWLQAPAAGPVPGYFFPEMAGHPMTVTNLRGIHRDVVATHAVALVLALARQLPLYLHHQVRREWVPHPAARSPLHLPKATVVLVGSGEIGAEVARMLAAFGCRILAVDERRTSPPAGTAELYPAADLDQLLPAADVVVVTVPHTPETENMFDASRFALLRDHAFFVNVGRGPVVDVDALADAIESGRLGGAGMDVFPEEPLPADHLLWSLPQVIVTPHSASFGVDDVLDDRIYDIIRTNAECFVNDRELINVVDPARWF